VNNTNLFIFKLIRVWVNYCGLKLNGTHQLLVYAADVNLLGRSVHTIKTNTENLLVAIKETGLEISADETKYMVMSLSQNAGQIHNYKD
jgi:hypothetical protein